MLSLDLALSPGFQPSSWFADTALAAPDVSDGIAKPPAFIADFRRGRHALTSVPPANIPSAPVEALVAPQPADFAALFSFTRASPAEYVEASGAVFQAPVDTPRFDHRNGYRQLLLEGPATNLFLNSHAPATQIIAVVSGTQYMVSCRGAGSLTLSGAASGSVTQASPQTFTAATASLSVTVSNSLSRAQVEAGASASSFVQTGASPATRAADSCRFSPVAEALVQKTAATVLVRGEGITGSLGRLVGASASDEIIRLNTPQTAVLSGTTLALAAVTIPLPAFGLSLSWNGSGRSGSYNGSAAVSEATVPAASGQIFLGRSQAGLFASGRYDSLTIWPFRATNAALQAKSTAYI